MKLYIFEYVAQCSENYHAGGGVTIIAKDKKQLKKMVDAETYVEITEDDLKDVVVYDLAKDYEPKIYVFEDAGCC